ncbi:DoxX family protein [Vibrio splendidus]|uniref:DoxD family protein n=2 Tax=Vibrio TaxID=662 RepID=A0A4R3PA68_9VIBR|nr:MULTISPECIES: DoxX family protein [Vibrio]MDH5919816.1 DoxX family protein [Vibrio splendidus]TCN05623.1 putative membrane protein YphA (DoxX/SURF4 family) [Vibrio crassostreae]TCT46131.1 putative membrane protein YphA (DoxX/SURF4 family) [Vibrio crassostreae]TCT54262.1 putative membrane protein YphA (DoxX/SURF4 family) [Vibrio crassostreae]TCT58871.1 putative membrane protein YphA (DoxX/SURF4 family) [Vibrio crassostreae]
MKDKSYSSAIVVSGLIAFLSSIFNFKLYDGTWSAVVTIGAAALIPITAYMNRRNLSLTFLLPLFFTTIVVRNADQHDWTMIGWLSAITYIPLLFQAIAVFRRNYEDNGSVETALSMLRVFIGMNWLTHCTEKLFVSSHDAGLVGFFQNVAGANLFGHPLTETGAHYLIVFAGFGELAAAIFLGLGLFTRFGAVVASIYLVFAEILSGHFGVGYTWMLSGGGWEVCFYYFMVTIPFLLPKTASTISLDAYLKTNKSEWRVIRAITGA